MIQSIYILKNFFLNYRNKKIVLDLYKRMKIKKISLIILKFT